MDYFKTICLPLFITGSNSCFLGCVKGVLWEKIVNVFPQMNNSFPQMNKTWTSVPQAPDLCMVHALICSHILGNYEFKKNVGALCLIWSE